MHANIFCEKKNYSGSMRAGTLTYIDKGTVRQEYRDSNKVFTDSQAHGASQ